jgi:hypothetical protein
MAMTIPIGKTLIIKHKDIIVFKRPLPTYIMGLDRPMNMIISNLRNLYISTKGYHFVENNLDFEGAGYNIDDLSIIILDCDCDCHIGCNRYGVRNECN